MTSTANEMTVSGHNEVRKPSSRVCVPGYAERLRSKHGVEAAAPTSRLASSSRLPTVSVIVPCYNYGHFLEQCVASVLAQRGVETTVLVIDDCSTDDSADVARRVAERDHRVEFCTHSANVGLMATINEGLNWVRGDYIVCLDADDLLAPGALERAAVVMAKHPNVGMVYGRPLYAYEGRPSPQPSGRWHGTAVWNGADWIERRCRSGHNCVSSPTAVMRRTVQQLVGGYDSACQHTSDLNMWLRIAAVADIAHVRAHQAIYRVHAKSMSHSQEGSLMQLRERRTGFDSFFAEGAGSLDGREQLRATVARTLARQALWRASRAIDRGEDERRVDDLIDFALETYAGSSSLREWRGLQLRRRIGPGRSLVFPPFLVTGAVHRLRARAGWTRLRFRGV